VIICYCSAVLAFFATKIHVVELCGHKQTSTKSNYFSILEIYDQIEYVRGVVSFNNKWTPKQVDRLEFQDENYRGLFFWYNEILKDIADTNAKNTK